MQVLALKRTHIGPRVLPPGEAGGGGGAVPETPETIGGRRVRPRPAMPGEVADQSTFAATTTTFSCTAMIDDVGSSSLGSCGGGERNGHGQGWARMDRVARCVVRHGRHHGPAPSHVACCTRTAEAPRTGPLCDCDVHCGRVQSSVHAVRLRGSLLVMVPPPSAVGRAADALVCSGRAVLL